MTTSFVASGMPDTRHSAARYRLPGRTVQGIIGLGLASAIAGAWLAIHFWGMFVFELTWANLPLALGLALVQCWLFVGVFIVCHDAMHGTLVPGARRINAAVGTVLLFLYAGFGWRKLCDAHFTHHRCPGSERDPDFDERNPASFTRWYAMFFSRYFGWRSLLFVSVVVTLYWLVFDVPIWQIFVLYGLPALLSSLQLFYFGTYRPHNHAHDTAFADEHNARSDAFGTAVSLASCFHFGYHLEHHRRPDVPWWALPAAKRAGVGQAPGKPVQEAAA